MRAPPGYSDEVVDALSLAVDCGFSPSPYFRDLFLSGKGIGSMLLERGAHPDQPLLELGLKGGDVTLSLQDSNFGLIQGIEPRSRFREFAFRAHELETPIAIMDRRAISRAMKGAVLLVHDEWIALGNGHLLQPSVVREHTELVVVLESRAKASLGCRSEDGSLVRWTDYRRWLREAVAHQHMGVTRVQLNDFYNVVCL